jgi:hypothetical protein
MSEWQQKAHLQNLLQRWAERLLPGSRSLALPYRTMPDLTTLRQTGPRPVATAYKIYALGVVALASRTAPSLG